MIFEVDKVAHGKFWEMKSQPWRVADIPHPRTYWSLWILLLTEGTPSWATPRQGAEGRKESHHDSVLVAVSHPAPQNQQQNKRGCN